MGVNSQWRASSSLPKTREASSKTWANMLTLKLSSPCRSPCALRRAYVRGLMPRNAAIAAVSRPLRRRACRAAPYVGTT